MSFWLCFVPLFVAVDAIGVLPLFISLTGEMDGQQVRKVIIQSVLTATLVALAFLAAGPSLLRFLGISVEDFMIAGGTLLFAISMVNLLGLEERHRHRDAESLGAVPLGVPLITGPAVLTTSILLLPQHHFAVTALALVANTLLAGVIFSFAKGIFRLMGKAGVRTIAKVAYLILAAVGVMMVRKGILVFVRPA
jgi:multiple antibiotic resistance protein